MSTITATAATVNTVNVSIPSILTANCYFWAPGSAANQRRRNEEKNQSTVAKFFAELGFDVTRSGDNVTAVKGDLEVVFHYSESCSNVYKSLSITRAGRKSNITAIKKLIA